MAAKFFGQFLLEKGALSTAQLLQALDLQRQSNPPLGELAEEQGLLTRREAQFINERQKAEDKRFGDLAEEMGMLDSEQVAALLAEQKARSRLFGQVLLDEGFLTQHQLDTELALHQQERKEALVALELGIGGHPLEKAANHAISACTRLFPRIVRSQCQFSRLLKSPSDFPPPDITAHVKVHGAHPMIIGIGCGNVTMLALACGFLSIPMRECDMDLAKDALGELVNVLMGYVVKETLDDDMRYKADPPAFDMSAGYVLERTSPGLVLEMTSQVGNWVLVLG